MTLQLKSASANPTPSPTVIHTATTPAVMLSAIAATTNGTARQASIGIRRAGVVSWLSQRISIAANASASILPDKAVVQTGDEIVCAANNAVDQRITISPFPGGSNGELLCNPDASVQVWLIDHAFSNGIYTSLDGQQSNTKTSGATISANTTGEWIAGAFRIYTSATTSVVSPDGQTWASTPVTNAPQVRGSLVSGGTAWYGLASGGTQVVKTTDGVTWVNHGPALPAACKTLRWTGTHLVAAPTAAVSSIYRSTAGGAWATVAVSGVASQTVNSLASDGAGTVLAGLGAHQIPRVSTDHGATWSDATDGSATSAQTALWTGQAFGIFTTTTAGFVSASGAPGTFALVPADIAAALSKIAGGRVWGNNVVAYPDLRQVGGCTITVSMLEA